MSSQTASDHCMIPPRPPIEVAQIFRSHGHTYRKRHGVTKEQYQAMIDIERCRTAALGGHVDVCDHKCGYMRISYNSCRNRNCPKCQSLQSARWLHARLQHFLPTPHFHVVVTLPHELRHLILGNQRILYTMLFHCASQSLIEMARHRHRLKAYVGLTAVLHTWSQDMLFHPHLHMVVTAGGLDQSGTQWVASKDNFLVPVRGLSKKIQDKFLNELNKAFEKGELAFHTTIQDLQHPKAFVQFLRKLRRKKWVVYSKAPCGDANHLFTYLSAYTHKVAISNHRLHEITEEHVTFRARDNHNPGTNRFVTVSPEEFIRRFLLHVLPSGFMKVRHYGLMASCNAKTKLTLAKRLIEETLPQGERSSIPHRPGSDAAWQELLQHLTDIDLKLCPQCGTGRLIRHPLSSLHDENGISQAQPIFPDSS